jgi:hypothetical protein
MEQAHGRETAGILTAVAFDTLHFLESPRPDKKDGSKRSLASTNAKAEKISSRAT